VLSAGGRTEDSEWSHHLCRKKRLSHTSVYRRGSFWFSFASFDKKYTIPAQMAWRRTDVDNISLTQLSPVWDSMTDNFVDRPKLYMRQ